MRPELETYQLIDTYLNGMLTGEDLRAFEQQLQTDPSLAEEVSFQQLTNEVVVGANIDSLRSQMTADLADMDSSKNTRTWGLTSLLLGIGVIGVIGLYTFSKEEENNTSVTAPAFQQAVPAIKHSTPEQPVATRGEKETQATRTEKSGPVITQTNAAHSLSPETVTVQTPVQQHTSDQTNIEKPVTKPIETMHTPASKTTGTSDPCMHIIIKAVITPTPSCDDASNGSIYIPSDQISGGSKPYHIAFNRSKDAGKKELYSYLAAGTYSINITDANGCSNTFSSDVAEKNCRKTSYIFAPDKGQVCTITGKDGENYILRIFNLAGKELYKTNTMDGNFEWQGLSQQGEYLDAGLYIYILEYVSGEKENGQITIVR